MNGVQATLRYLRFLHAIFLLTVPLDIYALALMRPQQRHVSLTIVVSFAAVSGWVTILAVFFRSSKVAPAMETLRRNPEDSAALTNWRFGNLLSFTLTETIVLFGFVLKCLGTGWNVAGVFFAVGVLLFLAWTPRLDVPTGS